MTSPENLTLLLIASCKHFMIKMAVLMYQPDVYESLVSSKIKVLKQSIYSYAHQPISVIPDYGWSIMDTYCHLALQARPQSSAINSNCPWERKVENHFNHLHSLIRSGCWEPPWRPQLSIRACFEPYILKQSLRKTSLQVVASQFQVAICVNIS